MPSNIELVVIKNALEIAQVENLLGDDLTDLLKQAFDTPALPSGVRLYHNKLGHDVTPKTFADVDKLMTLKGKFYAVVVPQGLEPVSWVIIGISVLVSVGVALLLPKLLAKNATSYSQPPSPNMAFTQATAKAMPLPM